MLFPTLCADNFFTNPDKVLSIAKNCPMKETSYRPGTRSPCLSTIDHEFYQYVNTKIIRMLYPTETNFGYNAFTHFQSTYPDDKVLDGWVHTDSDFMLTAIVYLNHCRSGTSIFTKKNDFDLPNQAGTPKHNYFANHKNVSPEQYEEVKQIREQVNSQFEEAISIKGKFNRVLCFDGSSYHTVHPEPCEEERLILISFFTDIRMHGERTKYPLIEMNSL
tara:strand:- start:120 stop:776 length:657 start_codon:yes stop_codon:yes gene_type:complete